MRGNRRQRQRQREHRQQECGVFGQQQLPAAHRQQAITREPAFAIQPEQALRVARNGADHREHGHRHERLVRQRRAESRHASTEKRESAAQ